MTKRQFFGLIFAVAFLFVCGIVTAVVAAGEIYFPRQSEAADGRDDAEPTEVDGAAGSTTSTPMPTTTLTFAQSTTPVPTVVTPVAQVPTTTAPVTASGMSNPAGCSTRQDADVLMFDGKDVLVQIGTESLEIAINITGGAYQFNTGRRDWTWDFVIPLGWFGTIHRPDRDKAELFIGDGQTRYTAFRATFRDPDCYPASDVIVLDSTGCTLLWKENTNGGSQDWQFSLVPGNITCAGAPQANVQGNLASNTTSALPTNCPIFGGVQTTPGSDGAPYCKYSGAMVTDVVPANFTAHYWTGDNAYGNPGEPITANEVTFRPVVTQ